MPTLTVDGATVAYSDTGVPDGRPDAPTIVFGHGLLFSGRMFDAQITALRGEYRCVAVDWRGQGDSPPAHRGYDMDTLADDAIALIRALDVGPVHWVGLSMGGFVGQRVAARQPELIRKLVLLDTSAEPESLKFRIQDTAMAHLYRFVGMGPVRGQVEKIMFGPAFRRSPQGRQAIDAWAAGLARSDRAAIKHAVLGVVRRQGVTTEIGLITAPTLVCVGIDDAATPPERSRTIARLIPGARLEVIADCGHSSSVEQPERVTELISEFLGDAGPGADPAADQVASS